MLKSIMLNHMGSRNENLVVRDGHKLFVRELKERTAWSSRMRCEAISEGGGADIEHTRGYEKAADRVASDGISCRVTFELRQG